MVVLLLRTLQPDLPARMGLCSGDNYLQRCQNQQRAVRFKCLYSLFFSSISEFKGINVFKNNQRTKIKVQIRYKMVHKCLKIMRSDV